MATDQQAAMEQLRALYRGKNEHLEKFLEPVMPFEFYREIFPVGSFERKGHFEDEKGNGIAVTVPPKAAGIALEIQEEGKAKRYTITDELSELSEVYDTDFTIMSPLSYFGRRRCGKNARSRPRVHTAAALRLYAACLFRQQFIIASPAASVKPLDEKSAEKNPLLFLP